MTDRDYRPAYVQLAEEVRDEIEAGHLLPGDPLPSESDFAARHNLSRTTVRQAVALLRSWGAVESRKGRGTFVRRERAHLERWASTRYQWEKDRVHLPEDERHSEGSSEKDTGLRLDDFDFRATYDDYQADERLAGLFGVPIGTALLRRRYSTHARRTGHDTGFSTSYLRRDLIEGNPALLNERREPWPGGTMHQLWTVGIEIDHIDDYVTSRPGHPDELGALGLEHGAAVILLTKISTDTEGRVVEVADITLPADSTRLRYTTQLTRWETF